MRIIAGQLKGHSFSSPHSNRTHPMSDKIRGALFNSIGDISGLRILDAFSGTGAISFEAISRGAHAVVAIDSDRAAFSAIVKSRQFLAIEKDRLKVIQANCYSWSLNNSDIQFDVVIVDPPFYNMNVNPEQIFKLKKHTKIGGLFVASLPPKIQFKKNDKLTIDGLEELLPKKLR